MDVLEYKQERWDPDVIIGHSTVYDKLCAFARKADCVLCRLSSHAIQEQANFLEQRLGSPIHTLQLRLAYLSAEELSHAVIIGRDVIICQDDVGTQIFEKPFRLGKIMSA